MVIEKTEDLQNAVTCLQRNEVAVLPTDTIYGIVGKAWSEEAVRKIYSLKNRLPTEPSIILISHLEELRTFHVKHIESYLPFLEMVWPGPLSIVFDVTREKLPSHLPFKESTLSFRFPSDSYMREVLRETGPLIAPSANPRGEKPAENIREAQNYFGTHVCAYIAGTPGKTPSTLIEIKENVIKILREGAVSHETLENQGQTKGYVVI